MRRFLAERDIASVYRLLQRHGVSQRAIAARTGQAQSEVSEIIAGPRQVSAYDLLVRIADGLAIPRGWLGVAHDESSQPYLSAGGES
jgi:transcriptional regulator with XRE-family HTH domain